MKKCPDCERNLLRSEFAKHTKRSDGLQSTCKSCKKKRDAEYYQRHKERILEGRKTEEHRLISTARRYGISVEELVKLRSESDGMCYICKVREGTCVDHCHSTEVVRGLLCRWCNSGLGYFFDNVESMKSAIEYLNGQLGLLEAPPGSEPGA